MLEDIIVEDFGYLVANQDIIAKDSSQRNANFTREILVWGDVENNFSNLNVNSSFSFLIQLVKKILEVLLNIIKKTKLFQTIDHQRISIKIFF